MNVKLIFILVITFFGAAEARKKKGNTLSGAFGKIYRRFARMEEDIHNLALQNSNFRRELSITRSLVKHAYECALAFCGPLSAEKIAAMNTTMTDKSRPTRSYPDFSTFDVTLDECMALFRPPPDYYDEDEPERDA